MKKIILLLFLFNASFLFAQKEISGVVKDESNEVMTGVTIVVKGTLSGTITDFDGNYTIKAAPGDVLVFSYVGFNTIEKTVEGSILNVSMKQGVSLGEITLIGSRNPSRTAVNSLSPVDVIDVSEITSSSPQVNLNQILNFVAPSFNSKTNCC